MPVMLEVFGGFQQAMDQAEQCRNCRFDAQDTMTQSNRVAASQQQALFFVGGEAAFRADPEGEIRSGMELWEEGIGMAVRNGAEEAGFAGIFQRLFEFCWLVELWQEWVDGLFAGGNQHILPVFADAFRLGHCMPAEDRGNLCDSQFGGGFEKQVESLAVWRCDIEPELRGGCRVEGSAEDPAGGRSSSAVTVEQFSFSDCAFAIEQQQSFAGAQAQHFQRVPGFAFRQQQGVIYYRNLRAVKTSYLHGFNGMRQWNWVSEFF